MNYFADKIKSFLIVVAIIICVMVLFGVYAVIIAPSRALKPLSLPAASQASSTVTIDGHQFKVSLAISSADQQKGLSVFNSLPVDEGMLFLFPNYSYYSFWMKDMKFPIDILWIKDNTLVGIQENAPAENLPDSQLPNYYPPEAINKVLEINAGLSQKYGFKAGDAVSINYLP